MTDLARDGEHEWRELDPEHRECARCGLRIYFAHDSIYGHGWIAYNHTASMIHARMLPQRAGSWGSCNPKPEGELVLIEYTGNPDRFPGCERIMHRPLGAGGALLEQGVVPQPACQKQVQFYEVGTARQHVGWTWCAACWPDLHPVRGPKKKKPRQLR